MKNTKPVKCNEFSIFRVEFVLGVHFRKCVFPQWLAKKPPKMMEISKCLDLTGYTMVIPIFICRVIARNTPDAFQHVPDPFGSISDKILEEMMKLYIYSGRSFLHVGVVSLMLP